MSQCTPQEVDRLLNMVPQWRKEQALRYSFISGQFACLKSWEMLMNALETEGHSDVKEWTVEWTDSGKPYFANHPEIYFSISHCKEAIAIATNDTAIGIDIEANCRKPLFQPEDGTSFIEWWTRMEALVKMRGTGITDLWRETKPDNNEQVDTHSLPNKNYVYSVAWEKK